MKKGDASEGKRNEKKIGKVREEGKKGKEGNVRGKSGSRSEKE